MATTFATAVSKPTSAAILAHGPGDSQFHRLFATRPVERFEPNSAVFWEGDPADYVFELVEGVMRLYRLLPDGRRTITRFLFPGEILGVAFKDRYLFTAEAVTPVKLQRYPRTHLYSSLARMPGLSRELLSMACDELSAAQDQMLLLARKAAQERIASFLLSVAHRMSLGASPAREIDLPMTRLDIADYLGLTIETVSRGFTKLRVDGLISLPSPHRVVLRKPDALRAVSGEDEGAGVTRQSVRSAVWPS
jgi:CRP/FNR family transcriptional regulator